MVATLATYCDKEFWRDKSAWHFTDLTIDGRKLIFLLKALDRYGMRVVPDKWPLIDAVYKDKSLYDPPYQDSDWPRSSRDVHALLHRWCASFSYEFHPKTFEVDDPYPLDDWYECKEDDFNLAESIVKYCKPIIQEHADIHARILDELTEAFASRQLTAYRVELIAVEMAALPPSAWHGAKAVTDKRFYFGEVALDPKGHILDAERGAYQIYVDEAEFTSFLDRDFDPPPVTLEAWLEARIRHYDSLPKSGCDTVKTCYEKVLVDLQNETFEVVKIWEKFDAAFQKVKPELRRFGKTGPKTKKKAPVEVRNQSRDDAKFQKSRLETKVPG